MGVLDTRVGLVGKVADPIVLVEKGTSRRGVLAISLTGQRGGLDVAGSLGDGRIFFQRT